MKKIITITVLYSIFIFSLKAQNIIDTTSDMLFFYMGEQYIGHPMHKGESLYGIAKLYKVPLDQLIAYNNFHEKIKASEIIKIPVINNNYTTRSLIDTIVCCLHKVKRKETIYSIAKKYDISPELLVEFNPEIKKRGLKPKRYISIPEIKVPKDIEDDYFIYHPYKKGETPEILALMYSIPVKDILEFNTKEDFKLGKVIAIPKTHYNPEQVSILKADYLALPDLTGLSDLSFLFPSYPPCKKYKYNPEYQFNIALLLPLFINENSANLQDIAGNNFRLYDKSNIFYEYLFGTLIAIDELRQLGLNIHLHIYDTRKDSVRVKNILDQPEFNNMDLVIGPAYSYNYDIVRRASYKYKINFISPFSRKEEILTKNPFVFMVTPSDTMFMKRIAKFVAPTSDTSKIIILTEFSPYSEKLSKTLEKEIKIQVSRLAMDTLDLVNTYYDPTEKFDETILSDSLTNIIIIPSKNEVFVNGALNQLNTIKNITHYNIAVIGLPNWENFRNFDLQWYINLQIYYPSIFFLDKDNPEVKEFIKKYLNTFNSLPTYYSYIGYDITNYFVHALKQYGPTFQFCISPWDFEPNPRGIYINFDFKRLEKYSGFENNAVFMIHYDKNLRIHKIEKFKAPFLEQKQNF